MWILDVLDVLNICISFTVGTKNTSGQKYFCTVAHFNGLCFEPILRRLQPLGLVFTVNHFCSHWLIYCAASLILVLGGVGPDQTWRSVITKQCRSKTCFYACNHRKLRKLLTPAQLLDVLRATVWVSEWVSELCSTEESGSHQECRTEHLIALPPAGLQTSCEPEPKMAWNMKCNNLRLINCGVCGATFCRRTVIGRRRRNGWTEKIL